MLVRRAEMLPPRVHRAGLPVRLGLGGVREVGHHARHGAARGPAAGRAGCPSRCSPRRPRRPRATTRTSPSTQAVDLVGAEAAEQARDRLPRAVPPGRGAGRRRRDRHRRHQVRARLRRRRAQPVRRGAAPRTRRGFWPADQVVAGHDAAVLRQAAAARLAGRATLGQARRRRPRCPPTCVAATSAALRRRLRASHRALVGRLARCDGHEVPALASRCSCGPGSPIPRAPPSSGRCPPSASTAWPTCGPGRSIRFEVDAADEGAARADGDELADRFLTNPVIEESRLELEAI